MGPVPLGLNGKQGPGGIVQADQLFLVQTGSVSTLSSSCSTSSSGTSSSELPSPKKKNPFPFPPPRPAVAHEPPPAAPAPTGRPCPRQLALPRLWTGAEAGGDAEGTRALQPLGPDP